MVERSCRADRGLLLGSWSAILTATDHAGHAGHAELSAAAYSARSIYQLESGWTTAAEQPLRLGQLQGKVQVLAMVYTTCESACPIIVSLMQHIEAALPLELRSQVGFVLVTFDPARDTPAVLSAYSARMGLDPMSWLLLLGILMTYWNSRRSSVSSTKATRVAASSTRM